MARIRKSLKYGPNQHGGYVHREHVSKKNRTKEASRRRLRKAAYKERWERITERRLKTDLKKIAKGQSTKNITA